MGHKLYTILQSKFGGRMPMDICQSLLGLCSQGLFEYVDFQFKYQSGLLLIAKQAMIRGGSALVAHTEPIGLRYEAPNVHLELSAVLKRYVLKVFRRNLPIGRID